MSIYDPGSGLYETVTPIDYKKEIRVNRSYQHEKTDQSNFEFDLKDLKIKEKDASRNITNTDSK